jgi:NAD(P)-dependent dehydrogenase (short-subunit alcohol dehydrogenase family)
MKPPTDTVILITGATSGIGRHAALDLARRGYRVFATGRNLGALRELSASPFANLTALALDVTDYVSIEAAGEAIDLATGGHGVDVLVNNAGYGDVAPIEQVTDAELRKQYDTNVFGLMAVTRAFLPAMRARGAGRIVNVSSIGGRMTLPLLGAYNSTKYAVESLSDALRMELRPFGIRVSLLEPGVIRTEFTARGLANAERRQDLYSPYASVMQRYVALARRVDRLAPGPAATTRAIRHAIESRRPRARYVAPFWTGRVMTLGLVGGLPTAIADALMRRIVGLTPRGLRAHPAPAAVLGTTPALQVSAPRSVGAGRA